MFRAGKTVIHACMVLAVAALLTALSALVFAGCSDSPRTAVIASNSASAVSAVDTITVVGEATVKTHVARVLSKLGLRDRTRAVVYCYEHGLLHPGR